MSDEILVEDLSIPSDTDGVGLHLRRKRRADVERFGAERTVLLMHGATFPSASLFDVPFAGESFMDALAVRGHDVWALDARGYGGSTRPTEMAGDPEAAAPAVRTAVAVRDLGAAVRHVRDRGGLDALNLFGMSWGGSVTGSFAAGAEGGSVRRLVLLAPQWLADGPVPIDPGGSIGAFRRVDVRAFRERWLAAAPEAAREALIPHGWFEQWAAVTLATDPEAGRDGSLRAPGGAVLDVREYWTAGRAVYDPAAIRAPTLLVHAEWDRDVTVEQTLALFKRLENARPRRWVEIGEGTHMVIAERNRWQVTRAVASFLEEAFPGD